MAKKRSRREPGAAAVRNAALLSGLRPGAVHRLGTEMEPLCV